MEVGVLALQGAFAAHRRVLAELGAGVHEVRTPDDLDEVDALVLPGGESTTMCRLLRTSGLFEPLAERLNEGLPVLATCAGLILLAHDVLDGRPDQCHLDLLDVTVRRNAYGSQAQSFEVELAVAGLDDRPFHGVFIRAPRIERIGPDVEVMAELDGHPVLVRQGACTAASFHPELSADPRVHARFLQEVHA